MTAKPWMPFYVSDYLGDTSHLTQAEHGAYFLLILYYWQHGGLPDDDAQLARVSHSTVEQWTEIRLVMAGLFRSKWRHKRIDAELRKADDIIKKRSAAGKASAEQRANKASTGVPTNAQQVLRQPHTPLPLQQEQETVSLRSTRHARPPKLEIDVIEFTETFWPAYPHKVGKPIALRAFRAARTRASLEQIMDGLIAYVDGKPFDRQWLNPSTFLNQDRFNDHPAPVAETNGNGKISAHDRMFQAIASHVAEADRKPEITSNPEIYLVPK